MFPSKTHRHLFVLHMFALQRPPGAGSPSKTFRRVRLTYPHTSSRTTGTPSPPPIFSGSVQLEPKRATFCPCQTLGSGFRPSKRRVGSLISGFSGTWLGQADPVSHVFSGFVAGNCINYTLRILRPPLTSTESSNYPGKRPQTVRVRSVRVSVRVRYE